MCHPLENLLSLLNCSPVKSLSHYFLYNLSENERILIIFGTQNLEDI